MAAVDDQWDDDVCSVIGDKGEIGYIDFQDDRSVCSYNPIDDSPIIISYPFPIKDGKQPQSVIAGETAVDSVTIENNTDEAVELWTKIYASTPENSFTLSLMKPPSGNDENGRQAFCEFDTLEDRMLQPRESLTIWLSCKTKEIGLYTSVVHFDVGSDRVERVAFVMAEDQISQSLTSRKPYSRAKPSKKFIMDEFVAGSRPERARRQGREYKNRLPRYDIPKDFREMIENKEMPDVISAGLTRDNYADYFKTLLIMEELQLEEDMRTYDMDSVSMRKTRNFLALVVPGLAERRPSLVHGDHIFAKLADANDFTSAYEGFVHRVEADEVSLKFDPAFHLCHRDENLYSVHFTYNRINTRRLYQAVDAAKRLDTELLFPSESSEIRFIETIPLVPLSCKLNEEQIFAIEKILGCKGGPPYVIYGPPGTGKTVTMVEAILQIYKSRRSPRVLVCAPSNSAADYLLDKLINEKAVNIQESDIFRLNATTRAYGEVIPDHLRFCFFDDVFTCPPLYALLRYKIVICTYMSASLLYAEGVRGGHFSHIFLDEAGQASELESMIPISNLYRRDTVVVLAGDPMQLGPVIYSKIADTYGLGKSYLERLCESEFYCEGDDNYVTKLVRNYRCHPDILHLPSTLFYKGELIPCKESTKETTSILSLANLLPGNDFPVLFYGIQGCDEREGSNPSWFNRIEASKVVGVIQMLILTDYVRQEDIGVITPYRQQVLKLKNILDGLDMPNICVGSVEQFQGQERKVIIISTVRSTVKHKDFDRAHCLGFLSNPRRFNVAITRAIALLVIIGNPHIISMDPFWNKLLWYSADNNSYQGCGLPERWDSTKLCASENDANYEEYPQPTDDSGCAQEFPKTENPVAGTDEAEWSDWDV